MTAKNRKEAEPVFCQVAALRYAKVLNELGISKEAVLEAENIFGKSQELKAALVNPVITKETKHNIIDKVFSEEMRTFLKVVCDHEKMTIAEQIFAAEDKALIGGFILQVDGKEYDYSVQGRLNRLQRKLTN